MKQKCNPSDCGKFSQVEGKKPFCSNVFEECKVPITEKIYTQVEVLNRTSDLVCFACGRQFLNEKQKTGSHMVTANISKCGLCGKKTHVTNIRHFNYLKINE